MLIAALVVAWVLVFLLAGVVYLMIKQHGESLIFQRELMAQLDSTLKEIAGPGGHADIEDHGLEIGSEAPEFALSDLDGQTRSLGDYRGQPFVMAFFSPSCGYCQELAPALGKLDKTGRPLVLVTNGEVEENRQIAARNDWDFDVLLQKSWEVSQPYESIGTPSGYLIDAEGRIASKLAIGGDAVLGLFEAAPAAPSTNGHADGLSADSLSGKHETVERARAAGLPARDVAASRIVRDGLDAGAIAPTFVLPDPDGEMRSLVDYRGKRVLLVFSDLDCGPCNAMAPDLVRTAEAKREEGLEVVMISRGDAEQNRAKAVENGYTFPVLLQRSREISKLYGTFATPAGYLIDERGVLASDVALGKDAILALV